MPDKADFMLYSLIKSKMRTDSMKKFFEKKMDEDNCAVAPTLVVRPANHSGKWKEGDAVGKAMGKPKQHGRQNPAGGGCVLLHESAENRDAIKQFFHDRGDHDSHQHDQQQRDG